MTLLRVLGRIWIAPNNLIATIYIGLFWLLGWVRFERASGVAVVFRAVKGKWLADKYMRKWSGWAYGVYIVSRRVDDRRHIAHELRHVEQQMVFGIFFLPAYLLAGLWALITTGQFYYQNPFEINARKAAERGVK